MEKTPPYGTPAVAVVCPLCGLTTLSHTERQRSSCLDLLAILYAIRSATAADVFPDGAKLGS